MGSNVFPSGIGPANSDIAAAVAAPSAATIASAVAAPSAATIQNIVTTYGNALGLPTYSLQQTLTSSSNNVSVPNNWVFAVVASGGASGGAYYSNSGVTGRSGQVVFGWTPKTTRVTIGTAGQPSAFGTLVASPGNNWQGSAANASIPEGIGSTGFVLGVSRGTDAGYSGVAGSGGGGATSNGISAGVGGNSTFGYNGGSAAAITNTGDRGGGGGGGAGIAGNGGTGGAPNSANVGGTGGNGGTGGGGAGAGGRNFQNYDYAQSGTGGSGAVLLYY